MGFTLAGHSMDPFPELSLETLRAIAEHHCLGTTQFARLPSTGVVNAIYALDEALILRVPKAHQASLADTYTESVAAPVAHAAGVRTPRLVVFDDSRSILDVPFTIYDRVHGETLGLLEEPADLPASWRCLGRDVAHLHAQVHSCADPSGFLDQPTRDDPRPDLEALASEGALTASHARWLHRWLERLEPAALAPVTPRFLHDDLQATNVMVTTGTHEYLAMIDWGDAGWGDPSLDLGSMPLRAIPFALEGYRQVQPFENDETVEARVFWDQIAHALHQLRHPDPGRSRAGYVWELLRFTVERTDPRFAAWLPAQPA